MWARQPSFELSSQRKLGEDWRERHSRGLCFLLLSGSSPTTWLRAEGTSYQGAPSGHPASSLESTSVQFAGSGSSYSPQIFKAKILRNLGCMLILPPPPLVISEPSEHNREYLLFIQICIQSFLKTGAAFEGFMFWLPSYLLFCFPAVGFNFSQMGRNSAFTNCGISNVEAVWNVGTCQGSSAERREEWTQEGKLETTEEW